MCIADLCLYDTQWHHVNFVQVDIYRRKIVTTYRLLFLSDFPGKTRICREFSTARAAAEGSSQTQPHAHWIGLWSWGPKIG